jgi:hypothetical protein
MQTNKLQVLQQIRQVNKLRQQQHKLLLLKLPSKPQVRLLRRPP